MQLSCGPYIVGYPLLISHHRMLIPLFVQVKNSPRYCHGPTPSPPSNISIPIVNLSSHPDEKTSMPSDCGEELLIGPRAGVLQPSHQSQHIARIPSRLSKVPMAVVVTPLQLKFRQDEPECRQTFAAQRSYNPYLDVYRHTSDEATFVGEAHSRNRLASNDMITATTSMVLQETHACESVSCSTRNRSCENASARATESTRSKRAHRTVLLASAHTPHTRTRRVHRTLKLQRSFMVPRAIGIRKGELSVRFLLSALRA